MDNRVSVAIYVFFIMVTAALIRDGGVVVALLIMIPLVLIATVSIAYLSRKNDGDK